MDVEMERKDEDCRKHINSVLAGFHVTQQEPFFYILYLPSDFEEPERQQFMSTVTGVEGCRERFPTVVDFWVHALFNFLESQIQDQRFEEQAREALGETVELIDLADLPKEAFSVDVFKEKPAELEEGFAAKVLESDGIVVVVPEYNGSFPGILKHFIDLLPFPESFDCRPVAFIGLAAGYYGALRAVEQLQMVFAYRNAYLFNRRVFIPAAYKIFDEEGRINDEELKDRLELQARKFLAFTRAVNALD